MKNFLRKNKVHIISILIGLLTIVIGLFILVITKPKSNLRTDFKIVASLDNVANKKTIYTSLTDGSIYDLFTNNFEKYSNENTSLYKNGEKIEVMENIKNSLNKNNSHITSIVKNDGTALSKTQEVYKEKFKVDNPDIAKMKLKEKENSYFLFSYILNNVEFEYQFDMSQKGSFGINEKSSELLNQYVTINYYEDENNYSVTLTDKDLNKLTYVKTSNKGLTFNQILDEVKEKSKSSTFRRVSYAKEDRMLFPSLNIIAKNNIKNIDEYVLKDSKNEYSIERDFSSLNFSISGFGKSLMTFLDDYKVNILTLDSPYMFDFTSDAYLYINNNEYERPFMFIAY